MVRCIQSNLHNNLTRMPKDFRSVAGIDLGTTNSCICVYRHETVEVVTDPSGKRTTPSMVAFTDRGRLFGTAAKSQIVRNFKNTVYDVKRLIGHKFSDDVVQSDMKHWGFAVEPDPQNKPVIKVMFVGKERTFTPEEISSMVIEHLVTLAKQFTDEDIKNIVITVPAYFNDNQRRATMDAGELAGYRVLGVLNEPTAAAIAYGFENAENEKKILVYDLGGGTFDVTVLSVSNRQYRVITTGGDTHLGGDDLDYLMMEILISAIEENGGSVDRSNKRTMADLRAKAEAIKIDLSQSDFQDFEGDNYGCETLEISRARFEDCAEPFFNKTLELVQSVLTDAQLTTADIDDVVLIGGSSRIPIIKTKLEGMFGEGKVYEKINPDEAVAKGAVIQAVKLYSDLPDEAASPVSDSDSESDSDVEAGGDVVACIDIQKIQIQDVVPLSIGLKTHEGKMSVLIPRSTPYGGSATKNYVTSKDNQQRMKVRVYQGERIFVKDNYEIGTFTVNGITPLPAGEASVDITMSTDKNGILTVTANDLTTGKETSVTFENKSTNLSLDDILRMKKTATEMREIDLMLEKRLDLYNIIENRKYVIEDLYEEHKEQMKPEFRENIEQFLEGINDFLRDRNAPLEDLEANSDVCQKWIEAFNVTE